MLARVRTNFHYSMLTSLKFCQKSQITFGITRVTCAIPDRSLVDKNSRAMR